MTDSQIPEQDAHEQAQKVRDKMNSADLGDPSFEKFIGGMVQQVLFHLGILPNPVTGKQEINLMNAKYTIDLIDILKQKTEGNLSSEEETLITQSLYDLRMAYVQATQD